MTSVPLLECSALQPFAEYLQERGCKVERLLLANRISPEMVERGEGRITKVQAYGFLEDAAEYEGVPDLGYRVGETFHVSKMGGLGTAILQAVTLADAVQTFADYLNRWVAGNRVTLEREGDDAWLRVSSTDELSITRRAANQNGVFIMTHLVRLAAGPDWCPTGVLTPPGSGASHEEFEALAGVETDYDTRDLALRFPAELLALPVRRGEVGAADHALEPAPPSGFAESLGETLLDQLPHTGLRSLAVAAEICGTSPRTLQRRLSEEGLTFRRLVERLCFTAARDLLLGEPGLSVRDIAAVLGYSGTNNFRRAFRRMTGTSPAEYRRRATER